MQRPLPPVLFAAAAIAVGTCLAGCYSEGGAGYSADIHPYVSYYWQPKTVVLKDTRTGEELWTYEVPVGMKLVTRFKRNPDAKAGDPTQAYPDIMLWGLMAPDEDFGTLTNQIPAPDKDGRQISYFLRPTPELPASMDGGVPTPSPSPTPSPKNK